jgi:hypothetical protein
MTPCPSTDPEVVLETIETVCRGEALLDKVKDFSHQVEARLSQALGRDAVKHAQLSSGPASGPSPSCR